MLGWCDRKHGVILVYPFDKYKGAIGIDSFIDGPSDVGWGNVADSSTTTGGSCCLRVAFDLGVHRQMFTHGDAARLERGVYLNDIDFYMQWYVLFVVNMLVIFTLCHDNFLPDTITILFARMAKSHKPDTLLMHTFSTHLYTALLDDGSSAVTKWMSKKKLGGF